MVGVGYSPKKSPAMPRLASFFVIALAFVLRGQTAHAQTSQPDLSDLLTRIDRLEETIRNLTGTVEQLQYRNQQLEQQVQQLQQQIGGGARAASAAPPSSPRPFTPPSTSLPPPTALPTAPGPIAAAEAPALPPPTDETPSSGRRSDAFNPTLNPNAPGVPRPLGGSTAANEPPPVYDGAGTASDVPAGAPAPRQPGAPLNLSNLNAPASGPVPGGGLPPPPPSNPSGTGAMQAALPPTNSPKDEYDLAYGYVLHKDYSLAADAFNAFLRKYPSDRMAPEAQYWLGEALFQNQNYHDAAEAFLAVSTKYETTARAPDALLRLGQSLAALGEKEAACASFGEVLRKYPRASLSVKQSVDREQKRVHC
jgi:tol-pal system protein YbgF